MERISTQQVIRESMARTLSEAREEAPERLKNILLYVVSKHAKLICEAEGDFRYETPRRFRANLEGLMTLMGWFDGEPDGPSEPKEVNLFGAVKPKPAPKEDPSPILKRILTGEVFDENNPPF